MQYAIRDAQHATRATKLSLYICKEPSTNQPLIMQNKANLLNAQMNVTSVKTKHYENQWLCQRRENKPNSNPISAPHDSSHTKILSIRADICGRLVYLSQPLPDKPDFLLYRLLGGLTEAINTCFGLHKDLLRRSL
ncbi:MAG: hypothetical protein ACYS1A_02615 [Planctomycetota bacterium]|jgi:hypothetical protein